MTMELTSNNFNIYAATHYDNPHCTDDYEFEEDLKRFQYIKRLFNKYKQNGELRERLILNHITIIHNVFGSIEGTRMLIFKLSQYLPQLKPFLILKGTCPDKIKINNQIINMVDIPLDQFIIGQLRKL